MQSNAVQNGVKTSRRGLKLTWVQNGTRVTDGCAWYVDDLLDCFEQWDEQGSLKDYCIKCFQQELALVQQSPHIPHAPAMVKLIAYLLGLVVEGEEDEGLLAVRRAYLADPQGTMNQMLADVRTGERFVDATHGWTPVTPHLEGEKTLVASYTPEAPQASAEANRRTRLIDLNLALARVAHQRAEEIAAKPVAVILLDKSDPFCQTVADQVNPKDILYTERVATQSEDEGTVPVLVMAMNQWGAFKAMRNAQYRLHALNRANPHTSEVVEQLKTQPPAGCFWCMCISQGKHATPIKRAA